MWKIEQYLDDQKIRFNAYEEVCTSTQEIFENTISTKTKPLECAQSTADIFTEVVNVATISSTLLGEMILRKIKGNDKK